MERPYGQATDSIHVIGEIAKISGVAQVHMDELRCGHVTHGGDQFKIRCGTDVSAPMHIPRDQCLRCERPDEHHRFIPGSMTLEVVFEAPTRPRKSRV